jgi:hypothetical protein
MLIAAQQVQRPIAAGQDDTPPGGRVNYTEGPDPVT